MSLVNKSKVATFAIPGGQKNNNENRHCCRSRQLHWSIDLCTQAGCAIHFSDSTFQDSSHEFFSYSYEA